MTLANFNSNFNWQLRALQQAAGCCGYLNNNVVINDCYNYFIFSNPDGFFGWTIDGLSLISDNVGDVVMPSYGGFGNVWIDGGGRETCIIGYIDPTAPPTPVILDDLGNPVPIVWTPCCSPLACLEVHIPILETPLPALLTGVDGYIITWILNGGLNFDPGDSSSVYSIENVLKRLYGPQFEVDVVAGPTSYTVYFRNVYVCGNISLIDKSLNYNDLTDASCVLPTCFCYEVIGITGSCALDYTACDGTIVNTTVNAGDNYSICVLDNLVSLTCNPGNSATLNGPNVACNGVEPRIAPPALGPIDGPADVCSYVASGDPVGYSYFSFTTVPFTIPFTYVWEVTAGCNIINTSTTAIGNTFATLTFDPGFTTGDISLTAYFGCNVVDTAKLTVGCPNCTYSAYFDPVTAGSAYTDLTGWTLNGNPLIAELDSLLNPLGGDVYDQFVNPITTGASGAWFYYYDTVDIGPLTFVAPDSSTYVVNFTKNSSDPALSCDTVCYQIVMPTASEIVYFDVLNPFNTLSCDLLTSAPVFGSILSNDQPGLQTLFQLLYGPQVTVIVVSALGNDTITIVDAYDFTPPVLYDVSFIDYVGTYVTCP
jgi:hypothetical protein